MVRNKSDLAAKLASERLERGEAFHSSGYAQAQNGEAMGAAGGRTLDVAARAAIEAQRKFVRGYRNAKIMQGVYGVERARTYVPRSRRGGDGSGGGGIGGAGGDVRSGRETFLKREK